MYDEHTIERPYIVWTFPFNFLGTETLTYDQFLARTVLVIMWLGFVFLMLGLVAGSLIAASLFSAPFVLLWYIMWKYGRREALSGYW